MGGTRKDNTARQLELPISYKEILRRIDSALVNANTLMYHVGTSHNQDGIEYWSGRLLDGLIRLSFDIEDAKEEEAHGHSTSA